MLGTLVIDEAGQASPQMALGAMFRCRKCIVVGDPKQIEPVVTDEVDLLKDVIVPEDLQAYKINQIRFRYLRIQSIYMALI